MTAASDADADESVSELVSRGDGGARGEDEGGMVVGVVEDELVSEMKTRFSSSVGAPASFAMQLTEQ